MINITNMESIKLHDAFFNRIKMWCKAHELTIETLMTDVSKGKWTKDVYQGWKRADGLPKGENILFLAKAMDVSCDWLITGADSAGIDALTMDEKALVLNYRRCDTGGKLRISAYAEGVADESCALNSRSAKCS